MNPTLIDTDILSEFLRGNTLLKERFDIHIKEFGFISISIITYYEIYNGLLYKDAKKQLAKFLEFVKLNKVLLISMKSARLSAEIQADLRKIGREIGHADTLIAGIALANDLVLVTNNTRHFSRINTLTVENWMKK